MATFVVQLALATGLGHRAVAQSCAPPTATTGNLLANADFETIINCGVLQPRNMPNSTNTKLCSWWDVNNSPSDPFNTCANSSSQPAILQYGVPNNLFGSRTPRSGSGYVGFKAYSYNAGNGNPTPARVPLLRQHAPWPRPWRRAGPTMPSIG